MHKIYRIFRTGGKVSDANRMKFTAAYNREWGNLAHIAEKGRIFNEISSPFADNLTKSKPLL